MRLSKTASFIIDGTNAVPIELEEGTDDNSLFGSLQRNLVKDIRKKPSYTDCWVIDSDDGETIASYRIREGLVKVSLQDDGETEYIISPTEYCYPDDLNSIICKLIEDLRQEYRSYGGRLDRDSVLGMARGLAVEYIDTISRSYPDSDSEAILDDICSIVYRYSVGAGIFEILLRDPHIEDVYVDAPGNLNRIYVTLNGIKGINSHMRCRTNLMVESKEISNLVNILKRESGLRFCQSNPVLETDFPEFDARATVIGYPMSPLGDAVAIRRHSNRPWTLSRLIFNGTIDPRSAGILSFLMDNRCTFLICGARGAGKSSLLSALMFEFSKEQRIITIEDTIELPCEQMRRMGYKVQSILVDDRMKGDQQSRSDDALRVSLRMGESALVLGEVRGEEAKTLYQSMRAGRAGSSILGTIHGDSAESVYQRVVSDLGVSPEAFMATDIIITLGTVKDRRNGRLIRRMNELFATGERPGEFSDISVIDGLMRAPLMDRILKTSQMGRRDVAKDITARALMRSMLAEAGNEDERFLGPEWIAIANDVLSRCDRKMTADEIARTLRGLMDSGGGRKWMRAD